MKKRGREEAGRGSSVTQPPIKSVRFDNAKERWPKRGPGEPPLRAAVAAVDDSDESEDVKYQAYKVLQEDEEDFLGYQNFKANRATTEYAEEAYQGPTGNA